MTVKTGSGTTFHIGPATAASTQSALAALSYTVVGQPQGFGEIGPQSQDVTFTPMDGTPVQHLKGSTDYGATAVTVARDPLDAGQNALKAAAATNFEYAWKIVLADAVDEDHTDSIVYGRGPVMSGRLNLGGPNEVTTSGFTVGNNVYIEVPSAAIP